MMLAPWFVLAATLPGAVHLADPRVADLFDDRMLYTALLPPAAAADAQGAIVALLRWPAGTRLAIEADGEEIVIRYDRPLDERRVEAFSAVAGDRIERLDWGPDNLVLAARVGQRPSARLVPEGVEISFTRDETAPAGPDDAAPDDTAAVAAQADAAAGYPARARRRLARIAAARPDDAALRASLASADYASGRIEDAARGYAALPDGGGTAGQVARRAIGPAVEGAGLSRDGRGFHQIELSARAGSPVSGTMRIEGAVRHVRTRGADPAGTPARLQRDVVEAGIAIAARVADDLRLRLDLTSLLDDDVTGAALTTAWGTPERRASLRLGWHLPDLVTPTGALIGGWLDRALVGGTLRPAPGVSVRLEAGILRYGLAGRGRAVSTAMVEAGLDYLVRRQSPAITLTYRMEGEYIVDRRVPAGPDPYAGLTDRENHSVEATIGQPIRRAVILTAAAGWTVSRFGDGGPTGAIGLSLIPTDGWEGNVQAGISSISRPGQPNRQTFGRLGLTKRFAATVR